MSRKKTQDPKLVALLDEHQKEHDKFDRWFRRLKRATNELARSRARLLRLARRIDELEG